MLIRLEPGGSCKRAGLVGDTTASAGLMFEIWSEKVAGEQRCSIRDVAIHCQDCHGDAVWHSWQPLTF
ncbi:MAG TPA: hypothetical protein VKU19_02735 [Bryobacteraceae bacterium]|nr:hypothetical protein [Bryobacteraceae bacterium]